MKRVEVDAEALYKVLMALNGPAHHVRELQVLRAMPGYDCPIKKLIDEYNEAVKKENEQAV